MSFADNSIEEVEQMQMLYQHDERGGPSPDDLTGYRLMESDNRHVEEIQYESQTAEVPCQPLPARKLPPSPSRSLGGYLDYAGWPDCERFIELDRALAARRLSEEREAA